MHHVRSDRLFIWLCGYILAEKSTDQRKRETTRHLYLPGKARSEREYLPEPWDMNICRECGKDIPKGTRVGSGKKSDGGVWQSDVLWRVLQSGIERERY